MSVAAWRPIGPGLRWRASRPGPWFQYDDPVGFEWNAYEVTVADLPPALVGLRIVHLSDLHCRPVWQTAYDELLDRINDAPPDLILLTGDVNDDVKHPHRGLPIARRLLNGLHARLGVFGQRGNHDLHVRPADLSGTPLQLIGGRRVVINVDGAPLELIGTPGPQRADCPRDFGEQWPARTPGVPRIVLSHYPDHFRRLRRIEPDLFLAGHTHGGQVCLPGRLPLLRHDSLPWYHFAGVHRLGRTAFIVNRGLGFSTLPLRIFCPAEVIELQLAR